MPLCNFTTGQSIQIKMQKLFAVNLMPFLPSKHLVLIATAFEAHDKFWPSLLV